MLRITQTEYKGILTVSYVGELDQHSARDTIQQSEDLLTLYPCQKMVLNLAGLSFMDSSGLAVVLHLYRTCQRLGCAFSVYHAPPQPMRVFEAAGLPRMIQFERENLYADSDE